MDFLILEHSRKRLFVSKMNITKNVSLPIAFGHGDSKIIILVIFYRTLSNNALKKIKGGRVEAPTPLIIILTTLSCFFPNKLAGTEIGCI